MSEAVSSTSDAGAKTSRWSKTNSILYVSQILSAWGDRMWQFGAGMFLVTIDPTSLRLTAIYGFASGGSILLLGAIIGNWVDKNQRLHVARTALIIQNLCVMLSASGVFFWIMYEDQVKTIWGGGLDILLQVLIVFFAVIADIASIGRAIAIQRDWIVIICKDNETLTEMSSFLRSIDLTVNLLAPIVTGQVMTYGSMLIGALFIAGWNLFFLPVEYGLLYAVYKSVPELAFKTFLDTNTGGSAPSEKTPLLASGEVKTKEVPPSLTASGSMEAKAKTITHSMDSTTDSPHFCMMFLESFVTIYRGWSAYINQKIVFAGFSLAFLYMTVLGFDNITNGYAKEQGLSESVISILLAAGALVGVFATFLFPKSRKWIGLQKTGLLAYTLQVSCLALCVVSIFVPGSPFDPLFLATGKDELPVCVVGRNGTEMTTPGACLPPPEDTTPDSYTSIIFLMTGIVSSRLGLWMSDLTVTQLLLETPAEHERGIINGVQNSLNKLMDIIKNLMVIFLPWPQTFGYLIIVSFAFIFIGYILHIIYARQALVQMKREEAEKNGSVGRVESGQ